MDCWAQFAHGSTMLTIEDPIHSENCRQEQEQKLVAEYWRLAQELEAEIWKLGKSSPTPGDLIARLQILMADSLDFNSSRHSRSSEFRRTNQSYMIALKNWLEQDGYWYIECDLLTCTSTDVETCDKCGIARSSSVALVALWLLRHNLLPEQSRRIADQIDEFHLRWPNWSTWLAKTELQLKGGNAGDMLEHIMEVSVKLGAGDLPSELEWKIMEFRIDQAIDRIETDGTNQHQGRLLAVCARLIDQVALYAPDIASVNWLDDKITRVERGGYLVSPRARRCFLRRASDDLKEVPLSPSKALGSIRAQAARVGDGASALKVADALIGTDPAASIAFLGSALGTSSWRLAASKLADALEQARGIEEDQLEARKLRRAVLDNAIRNAVKGCRGCQRSVGDALCRGTAVRIGAYPGADFATLDQAWSAARIWYLKAAGAANPYGRSFEEWNFEWMSASSGRDQPGDAEQDVADEPRLKQPVINSTAVDALRGLACLFRLGLGVPRDTGLADKILAVLIERGGRDGVLAVATMALQDRLDGVGVGTFVSIPRRRQPIYHPVNVLLRVWRQTASKIAVCFADMNSNGTIQRSLSALASYVVRDTKAVSFRKVERPRADRPPPSGGYLQSLDLIDLVGLKGDDIAGAWHRLSIRVQAWLGSNPTYALPQLDDSYEEDYGRWADTDRANALAARAIHRLLGGRHAHSDEEGLTPLEQLTAARVAGWKLRTPVARHLDQLSATDVIQLAQITQYFDVARSRVDARAVLNKLFQRSDQERMSAMLWLSLRKYWSLLLWLPDCGWWDRLGAELQLSLDALTRLEKTCNEVDAATMVVNLAKQVAVRRRQIARSTADIGPKYNRIARSGLLLPGEAPFRSWRDQGWQNVDKIEIGPRKISVTGEKADVLPPLVRRCDIDVLLALVLFDRQDTAELAAFSLEPLASLEGSGVIDWQLSQKQWSPEWLAVTDFGRTLYHVDERLVSTRGCTLSMHSPWWSAATDESWQVPMAYRKADGVGGLVTKPGGRLTYTFAGIRGASAASLAGDTLSISIARPGVRITGGETTIINGQEIRSIGSDDPAYSVWRTAAVLTQEFESLDFHYPVFGRAAQLLGILAQLNAQHEAIERFRSAPVGCRLKKMRSQLMIKLGQSRKRCGTHIVFQP
jgi:hypothetical protein